MAYASLLHVEIRVSDGSPPIDLARVARLLSFAAEREAITGEIAIWLCRDDEIADLHARFMNEPGPTDVISFPGDPPGMSDAHLGDIAVSVDMAARQGVGVGNGLGRELAYLALHGLLHLLAYDDLDPAGRERMIGRQDELLTAFERNQPGDWD